MLKIAVFDSERHAQQMEDFLVGILFNQCDFGFEAFAGKDAEKDFDSLTEFDFDIVFIEINSKEFSGIEIAKKIRENGYNNTEIILLSVDDSYALSGYKLHAFDYLVKPISKKEITETLDRFFSYFDSYVNNYFSYKVSGALQKINFNDIYYFMSDRKKCIIVTKKGSFEFYDNMENILKQANNHNFIRTQRSYIVQLKYVKSLTKDGITLTNGEYVPVSRGCFGDVKTSFMQYLGIDY